MATAVEPSSQAQTPAPPANLLTASLVGAVYVLAALAVVFYAVPALWSQYVSPHVSPQMDWPAAALRVAVQVAAAVGLGLFGQALAGSRPPRGVRGGIFLIISAACAIFFITRAAGLAAESGAGQVVAVVIGAALLFVAFKFFTSARGGRWMVGVEEQGWLHTSPYKKSLGQKVRRLTILGILLVGGTGLYALHNQNMLPESWTLALPFTQQPGAPEGTHQTITLVPHAKLVIPVLLAALTVWVAYRAVNMPAFAEFLIATEAEMNKVSWSTRKRLTQDTIVVLVTTVLMALFLLFVDLFWGWLLSIPRVGVLPSKSSDKQNSGEKQVQKW